ncbi:MAG: glycosyltransferase family 2 protein [Planctomycetota bacterium]|nr:MAG: glycosyltransferase family 2 protein [Planctomycetota bacterium]
MICTTQKSTSNLRAISGDSVKAGKLPTLTAVICTCNRPQSLSVCVQSVVRQSVPPMELIVVDDGRLNDQELESMTQSCRSAGISFEYLRKDKPGLPKSRNLAVRRAHGDIIQFLDDDVVLDPQFCREILQLYADDTAGAIVGTEGSLSKSQSPTLSTRIIDYVYRIAGWWALKPRTCSPAPIPESLHDRNRTMPTWKIAGATMAFRRSALLENAFDEALSGYALGEDRDMAYRMSARGWIVRSCKAKAVHYVDPSSRPPSYLFGQMIVRHYVRIMTRNGFVRIGDRLVIGYSLTVIALSLLGFSLVNPKRFFPQFLGMISAAVTLFVDVLLNRIESADCVE